MDEMMREQALTIVAALAIGSLLAIGLLSMFVGQIVRFWDWLRAWWGAAVAKAEQDMSSRGGGTQAHSRSELNERVHILEPHTNATEQARTSSANEPELGELTLSTDEIIAVQRMIEHNATAAAPSKSSTIQAGFGIKRGGGPRYQRASEIYDALFGVPMNGPQFMKSDGGRESASYPVSGR